MTVTAIVLAGRRSGGLDPLAAAASVPLKCLVPVAGRPLIDHVIGALLASPSITKVRVVVDEADPMIILAAASAIELVGATWDALLVARQRAVLVLALCAVPMAVALAFVPWAIRIAEAPGAAMTSLFASAVSVGGFYIFVRRLTRSARADLK